MGASDDPARIGGRVLSHVREHFEGLIYPVNAKRSTVQGLMAYQAVEELPAPPDLAVVAVPARDVARVVESLGELGTGSAVIFSSGFVETGNKGQYEQERIRNLAQAYGMRIVGPNCIGIINLPKGLVATFTTPQLNAGTSARLAIVSQSGSVGMMLWNEAHKLGLGASYLGTTGNEADVTAAEVVAYLLEQPDVGSIMLFIEALNDPEGLFDAGTRALELEKPIIAIKAGSTIRGGVAAVSHTGAIAVPDRLAQSLLDRAGIMRVRSPTELVYFSAAFCAHRYPGGDQLGVMTGSGGVGLLVTDEAVASGLTLPPPSPDTEREIQKRIPSFGSARNPIDITGNFINDSSTYEELLDIIVTDDQFDACCICGVMATRAEEMAMTIKAAADRNTKPVLVYTPNADVVRLLMGHGVPTFNDPVLMARAVGRLRAYASRSQVGPSVRPLLLSGRSTAGVREVLSAAEERVCY